MSLCFVYLRAERRNETTPKAVLLNILRATCIITRHHMTYMWVRATSLCIGCKVREAGKNESELNRKNRLDRARRRGRMEKGVGIETWERVLERDSNQRE